MYCPRCATESHHPGTCEQCGTTLLPDDQPNPLWESSGLRFQKWQLLLVTVATIVGVLYYLKIMNFF